MDEVRAAAPDAMARLEVTLRDVVRTIDGRGGLHDIGGRLCAAAESLVALSGSAALARTPSGALELAAVTDPALAARVRREVARAAGPVVDATRGAVHVRITDRPGGAGDPGAEAAGGVLHVLPLRGSSGEQLGALVLQEVDGRPLADEDLAAVGVLAAVAVTHLVHGAAVALLRTGEEASRHLALHDPLTGLPNRTLLLDRVEHVLSRAPRTGTRPALLFLDLDGFKSVNDRYGHQAGDAVLVETAVRITHVLRAGDTLARLGGDEFVVLCEDAATDADVQHLAARVASALQPPFVLRGGTAHLGASIGVAVVDGAGEDAETLLQHADAAMYRAKESGGGTVVASDSGQHRSARERAGSVRDLEGALARDELRLHFQPIVRLSDERVSCVEALVRWQHPARGLLRAATFIPLAEESALIGAIGRWTMGTACRFVAAHRHERPDLRVAVNLSPEQLSEGRFIGDLRAALEEADVDGTALVIEITERSLLQEVTATYDVLGALTGLGVGIAIDDFGVGYSSLAYLTRFPVDIVKLDQAFVAGLGVDEGAAAIAAAVVGLAHGLGLRVVAEGVEHRHQLEVLRTLDCDDAQGYHLGPPSAEPVLQLGRA